MTQEDLSGLIEAVKEASVPHRDTVILATVTITAAFLGLLIQTYYAHWLQGTDKRREEALNRRAAALNQRQEELNQR
jgi:hypothetical protein